MPKINLTRCAARLHLLPLAAPLRLHRGAAIRDSGWLRSFIEQKSVDAAGNPDSLHVICSGRFTR